MQVAPTHETAVPGPAATVATPVPVRVHTPATHTELIPVPLMIPTTPVFVSVHVPEVHVDPSPVPFTIAMTPPFPTVTVPSGFCVVSIPGPGTIASGESGVAEDVQAGEVLTHPEVQVSRTGPGMEQKS